MDSCPAMNVFLAGSLTSLGFSFLLVALMMLALEGEAHSGTIMSGHYSAHSGHYSAHSGHYSGHSGTIMSGHYSAHSGHYSAHSGHYSAHSGHYSGTIMSGHYSAPGVQLPPQLLQQGRLAWSRGGQMGIVAATHAAATLLVRDGLLGTSVFFWIVLHMKKRVGQGGSKVVFWKG